MWSRKTRFDFYWPSLAHLGEQAILNKEIYSQGATVLNGQGTPVDEDVFGYQERYAEYRYKPSTVTGLFRSNAAATLDVWHLAQKFTTLPALLPPEYISKKDEGDLSIILPNKSTIALRGAGNPDSLRGPGLDCVGLS